MDDFERRRELRRQKREEMRLEAERIAYQRNDDDEEEAARERRRRARQERLRQREEEESLGQVTEKVEVNAQNSVGDEETKTSTTSTTSNTQVEEGDDAAFLERLARREERRQKRLQEALERQKEFDPTITDESLSLTNRRAQNDAAENETSEKEEKSEIRRERYQVEETETVTKSYQKNDWREPEEDKKEEKKKEEEEEKPKQRIIEENQVEAMVEKKTETQEEEVVIQLKNGQIYAEEPKLEENRTDRDEVTGNEKAEEQDKAEAEKLRLEAEAEKLRLEAEAEKLRLEAEAEKLKLEAEQERKAEEERMRIEAEEREAAQEKERKEAEERERIKEKERQAAEAREQAKAEEKRAAEAEAKAKLEEQIIKKQLEEKKDKTSEKQIKGGKGEEKIQEKKVNEKKVQDNKLQPAVLKTQGEEKGVKVEVKREKSQEDKPTFKKEEIKEEKTIKDKGPKEDIKSNWDRKKGFPEVKSQNGELTTHKLKHTENTFSRSGGKGIMDTKEAEAASQVEAGKRLEELRRRRGETESEEFEKLKQKQQEAALELEELKKKREERRKVLEEEEQRKKQEEAERKAREEEEKRRLKEEIERRRAEAAEKRQKMPEDGLSDDKKPFKCFTPKGSSLKIEERAEFLNKSVQKSSGAKLSHPTAVVSKIDSRLEQYTSAIEGTKASKPAKPAPSDLPVPAEGVRNIKSMWEKGNVFASPSGAGTPNKETAGLKVGVSSRINEWLTKTPEGNKSPAPKPSDLRPGDVSSKRNLWEKQSVDKVTSPAKQV
ncbi:caldesmon isoform X1 [Monodelphis domestica]|uniref:caldesmon isoform X1 n=1 Tax=Monodelphis domestica TaxID=13616 RepID=UPI0024E25B71|nr:caldesmon isoform X1 [Monodelphis domestica]XP_007504408.2 caldesmon isoform X1 [Monodelphis domestica]XP_007504409.2 caldesmon isoform X1 [Monodelphis domestica]XP_007504410.2 caldesmon isoform X1 [Monodelphis domestica]